MLVGMFLFGCAMRLIDDVVDVRGNPHAVFLPLLLFPYLGLSELDLISIEEDVPVLVLLWVLVIAVTFRWRPRRTQA